MSQSRSFVSVLPEGTLIYVGVADRAEFDRIAAPCSDIENENGHVLAKSFDSGGVYIVFQHWLKSLSVEEYLERRRRARETADAQ